jgi:hypothetical protein
MISKQMVRRVRADPNAGVDRTSELEPLVSGTDADAVGKVNAGTPKPTRRTANPIPIIHGVNRSGVVGLGLTEEGIVPLH